MTTDTSLVDEIRSELSAHFTRTGEYSVTQPLLYAEIQKVFNAAFSSSYREIYAARRLSEQDALNDVMLHLLETRSGMKARLIHTVYFEYFDRNRAAGQPYTTLQSRKTLRKVMQQAFLSNSLKSIADNVSARAINLLQESPYRTHFEGHARRFTMEHQSLSQLDPVPQPQQLLTAVRCASQVPKIPQKSHGERVNKVYHTQDLHLVLLEILDAAPGLTISQLKQIFREILTDRPSAQIYLSEDMKTISEENSDLHTMAAGTAHHVRTVAADIWLATDSATKVVLALLFAGWTDQKIADQVPFDAANPSDRKSRSWVTTKFTNFGKYTAEQIADMDADDQMRVMTLLETHIVNFDTGLESE